MKALTQRQIDATDRQIDKLVYGLYGLTDEEIAIVEEATEKKWLFQPLGKVKPQGSLTQRGTASSQEAIVVLSALKNLCLSTGRMARRSRRKGQQKPAMLLVTILY